MKIKIFYTTCNSTFSKKLAKKLLLEKRVICVNVVKNVESFYSEDKLIKSTMESILIIKTFLNKSNLEELLQKYHNYSIPFIAEILVNDVNDKYLSWAKKNL